MTLDAGEEAKERERFGGNGQGAYHLASTDAQDTTAKE